MISTSPSRISRWAGCNKLIQTYQEECTDTKQIKLRKLYILWYKRTRIQSNTLDQAKRLPSLNACTATSNIILIIYAAIRTNTRRPLKFPMNSRPNAAQRSTTRWKVLCSKPSALSPQFRAVSQAILLWTIIYTTTWVTGGYKALGACLTAPIKPTPISVMADTGCQSCMASVQIIRLLT